MEESQPQQKIPFTQRAKNSAANLFYRTKKRPVKLFLLVCGIIILLQFLLLPFGDVRDLKTKNPIETAFMKAAAEHAKEEGKPFHKIQYWVPLKSIPQDAVDAVVVAEDGTFWQNEGFDWYEFRESVEKNWEEGKAARGASTITQQLVKNLYLSSSKNPLRKLKEWALTWYMSRQISKPRIIELYLNVIEWGNGVYGIEAASRVYFGKPAAALSREECARLAATIPSPLRHRADMDTKYVLRRSQIILERMNARGM
jgi:monofunctional glycosyltransferase